MKDDEFICDCSDIDDVIVFAKDGKYKISKVTEKAFYTKNILYIGIFTRNDTRTIYNILYRDGYKGGYFVKRCSIKGVTRDKEYDITQGSENSEIIYMSVNGNGEAESLKVTLVPRPRMRNKNMILDFADVSIRGRGAKGNTFTKNMIHKVSLKSRGVSTLKGQSIYYDEDIHRLNNEERGSFVGEFSSDDRTVIFTKRAMCYTAGYDETVHFPEDMTTLQKYDSEKVYSVIYYDAVQRYFYLKRFKVENDVKQQQYVDISDGSYVVGISEDECPQLSVAFGGVNSSREEDIINVEEFIGIKGFKAKGKRLTTYKVKKVEFIEPLKKEETSEQVIDDKKIAEIEQEQVIAEHSEESGVLDMPSIFDEFFK